MYLNLRRMPGSDNTYRIQFHTSPSESPQVYTMTGDPRDLERFLINRLDQRADTVARVVTETVHTGSSLIEKLDYTPEEIRLLLRTVEQERRAAETARSTNTMRHEQTV